MGLRNFNRSVSSWLTVKAQQDANLDSFIAGSEGTYPDTESCDCDYRNCNCNSLVEGSGRIEESFDFENQTDDEAIHGRKGIVDSQFDSNDDLPEEAGK